MYTKSIIYAPGIALLALAAIPVSAQLKFASVNTSIFASGDNSMSSGFLNYYAAMGPDRAVRNVHTTALAFSAPVSFSGSGMEEDPADKSKKPIESANSNRNNIASGKISFKRTTFSYPVNPGKEIGVAEYPADKLLLWAALLKQYAKKNGFDTTYAFLSNMGMLNSKKRFFVVNLESMEIVQWGLVAQGRGQGPTRFDKQYSNKQDSRCTSLGRYKILKKYKGEYGIAYRMEGLDSSNCNALKRNIVLHAMGCMPDTEEHVPVCISEGCPAISINFLSSLSSIIDSRKKPVLLWIFDSNLEEVTLETEVPAVEVNEKLTHRCSIHRDKTMDVTQY